MSYRVEEVGLFFTRIFHLIILPLANKRLTTLINQFAQAMAFIILPPTNVPVTNRRPHVRPVPMPLIILPLAVVLVAVGVSACPMPIAFVVPPCSVVLLPIRPCIVPGGDVTIDMTVSGGSMTTARNPMNV